MKIEVAYALRHKQTLLNIEVDDNASVEDAIQQSNILKKYPEINLKKNKVGIFGKITSLDVKLREKDRVEIYRPLIADPKEVRKQRAAEGKIMRSGKKS
ncbi:MAG: RnfH family protein [Gammaproteobacteria bacterium]|jgi:putative ubiquitin-RnfH superfamily antitoxin RatB of RatAB toxin-antitoxin module|nr:RnfH family protein [Gammaproteobacteria bacterium]NBQ34167.1 RnfH family protein [Gammaproteobacteria bacterium]